MAPSASPPPAGREPHAGPSTRPSPASGRRKPPGARQRSPRKETLIANKPTGPDACQLLVVPRPQLGRQRGMGRPRVDVLESCRGNGEISWTNGPRLRRRNAAQAHAKEYFRLFFSSTSEVKEGGGTNDRSLGSRIFSFRLRSDVVSWEKMIRQVGGPDAVLAVFIKVPSIARELNDNRQWGPSLTGAHPPATFTCQIESLGHRHDDAGSLPRVY